MGLGEAAALGTAVAWSACAQFFTAAGLRVGSVAVNHIRLLFAMAMLPIVHWIAFGHLIPVLSPRDLGLLVASGLVGIVLGDAAGFRALVLIGAARTTIVVTLTPAIAAILAFAFLDERLGLLAVLGMTVTLAGLLVGVSGRARRVEAGAGGGLPAPASSLPRRTLALGLLCALGGAVGQALGQVLAKPALEAVDPLSAALVRVASGTLILWGFTAGLSGVRRAMPRWWGAWKNRGALGLILLGTIAGPTLGVWLSQVATKHAPVGVAATLMALVPLFVLAQDAFVLKRRPSVNELMGAVLAIAGVVLLMRGSMSP